MTDAHAAAQSDRASAGPGGPRAPRLRRLRHEPAQVPADAPRCRSRLRSVSGSGTSGSFGGTCRSGRVRHGPAAVLAGAVRVPVARRRRGTSRGSSPRRAPRRAACHGAAPTSPSRPAPRARDQRPASGDQRPASRRSTRLRPRRPIARSVDAAARRDTDSGAESLQPVAPHSRRRRWHQPVQVTALRARAPQPHAYGHWNHARQTPMVAAPPPRPSRPHRRRSPTRCLQLDRAPGTRTTSSSTRVATISDHLRRSRVRRSRTSGTSASAACRSRRSSSADRVTGIDRRSRLSMGKGTIWTETDVVEDAYYMHDGAHAGGRDDRVGPGRPDAHLVARHRFHAQPVGERGYRLLGCELTYRGGLPEPGEDTLRYDIHVDGHAKPGRHPPLLLPLRLPRRRPVRMLTVRSGPGGLLHPDEELARLGKGILWDAETASAPTTRAWIPPRSIPVASSPLSRDGPRSRSPTGRTSDCFGPQLHDYTHAPHAHARASPAAACCFLEEVTHLDFEGRSLGPRLPARHRRHRARRLVLRGSLQERPLHARHPHVRGLPAGHGHLPHRAWASTVDKRRLALRARARGTEVPAALPRPGDSRVQHPAYLRGIRSTGLSPVRSPRSTPTCSARSSITRARPSGPSTARNMGLKPHSRLPPGQPPLAARGSLRGRVQPALEDQRPGPRRQLGHGQWLRASATTQPAWPVPGASPAVPSVPCTSPSTRAAEGGPPAQSALPLHESGAFHRASTGRPSADQGLGQVKTGVSIEIDYDVPEDCLVPSTKTQRARSCRTAVLLEAALQPCGWLASYVGSALKDHQPAT